MAINASPDSQENSTAGLYVDEVTQKKIQEHLNNEDDIITEQDIANISTGVGNDSDNMALLALQEEHSRYKNEEPEKEVEEKEINDNDSPAVETPWNILGS